MLKCIGILKLHFVFIYLFLVNIVLNFFNSYYHVIEV